MTKKTVYVFIGWLMQATASAEEFMKKLPQFDKDLARERQDAEESGEVSISSFLLLLYYCKLCPLV